MLNGIIDLLIGQMESVIFNLTRAATSLCLTMCIIDLTMSMLSNFEEDVFSILWKKFMKYAFFIGAIKNWNYLIDLVFKSFNWIGNAAVGIYSADLIVNPNAIIEKTISEVSVLFSLATQVKTLLKTPGLSTIMPLLAIVIVVISIFIAIEFGLIIIEFYLVSAFSIMLLPCGVYDKTSFIAQKAFQAVLHSGIKLGVIVLLYNLLATVYSNISLEVSFSSFVQYLGASCFLLFMTRKATSIANVVISGNGGYSEGRLISGMKTAVMTGMTKGAYLMKTSSSTSAIRTATKTAVTKNKL